MAMRKGLSGFDEGVKFLKQKKYLAALRKFNQVLKIDPNNASAWYYKGCVLAEQQKFSEAFAAFDKCLTVEPTYIDCFSKKARAHISLMQYADAKLLIKQGLSINSKHQDLNYLNDFLQKQFNVGAKEVTDPEKIKRVRKLIRQLTVDSNYFNEYENLDAKHQLIKELPSDKFDERIAWIVELLEFIQKYYTSESPILSSVPTTDSVVKKLKELKDKKLIDEIDATSIGLSMIKADSHEDGYPFKSIINLEELVFLEPVIVIRMIFETIHQLPRKNRSELAKLLPWGENSWFYLEFIGSVFFINYKNIQKVALDVMFPVGSGFTPDESPDINHFYNSVINFQWLVKTATRELIPNDLKKMLEFFKSIQTRRRHDDYSDVEGLRLESMSNLTMLLWYFKHSFNFIRLLILLPNPPNFEIRNKDAIDIGSATILPSIKQLQEPAGENWGTLKWQLATLRRAQLIGELFANRNFGSMLDSVDFVDPDLLSDIRNAMCHIERLESYNDLEEMEANAVLVYNLSVDLYKLKLKLFAFIEERQNKFTAWPSVEGVYALDTEKLTSPYWRSVKSFYLIDKNDPEQFAPDKLLFTPAELDNFIKQIRDIPDISTMVNLSNVKNINDLLDALIESDDFRQELLDKLHGIIPFKFKEMRKDATKESLRSSITGKTRDKAAKHLSTFLEKASKQFTKHKQEFVKTSAARKSERERAVRESRQQAMTDYPSLVEARSLLKFKQGQNTPATLVKCLKSRSRLLLELLRRNIDETDDLQSRLENDVELSLACSYVVCQIISLMNNLDSLGLLEHIHPGLKHRLADYVGLRNFLEHSDAIIDSKELPVYQMYNTDVNVGLDCFIGELLLNYYRAISYFNEDDVRLESLAQSDTIAPAVRQEEPMDIRKFEEAFSAAIDVYQEKREEKEKKTVPIFVLGSSPQLQPTSPSLAPWALLMPIPAISESRVRAVEMEEKEKKSPRPEST